jgi:hypothetical protein
MSSGPSPAESNITAPSKEIALRKPEVLEITDADIVSPQELAAMSEPKPTADPIDVEVVEEAEVITPGDPIPARPKSTPQRHYVHAGARSSGRRDRSVTSRPRVATFSFAGIPDALFEQMGSLRSPSVATPRQEKTAPALVFAEKLSHVLSEKLGAALDTAEAEDFRSFGKSAPVTDQVTKIVIELTGASTYTAEKIAAYALVTAAAQRQQALTKTTTPTSDFLRTSRLRNLEFAKAALKFSVSYAQVRNAKVPDNIPLSPMTPVRESAASIAEKESAMLLRDPSLTKHLATLSPFSLHSGEAGNNIKDLAERLELQLEIPSFQATTIAQHAFVHAAAKVQHNAVDGKADIHDFSLEKLRVDDLKRYLSDPYSSIKFEVDLTTATGPTPERTTLDMAKELRQSSIGIELAGTQTKSLKQDFGLAY